ncbi:MAG: hypothetical protein OXU81_09430 [Gammaproteobacteria bacterium]|nr:hypothetical protein [Gammaproteobacteria bacterium]
MSRSEKVDEIVAWAAAVVRPRGAAWPCPSLDDLSAWIADASDVALAAAHRSLESCLEGNWVWVRDVGGRRTMGGTLVALARDEMAVRSVRSLDLLDVHAAFVASGAPQEEHPLLPLLRAWYYERSVPSRPFRPGPRASFPRLQNVAKCGGALGYLLGAPRPAGPGGSLPFGGGEAPQFEVVDSCPSWLLELYASCRHTRVSSRGLPWAFRIVVAALVHLAIADRDGRCRDLSLTVDDVVDWLGVKSGGRWTNSGRDYHRLVESLDETQCYRVRVGSELRWLVSGYGVPAEYCADAPCTLKVVVPPGSGHGMRFNWWRFRKEAASSAVRARAYLSLMALLDRSAHKGQPITRLVRPPLKSPKTGLPVRARSGRIMRAAELVPNPKASLAPYLPSRHAAAFVGLDSTSKNKFDAMAAIQSFGHGTDAVVELVKDARGLRVYGVSPKLG